MSYDVREEVQKHDAHVSLSQASEKSHQEIKKLRTVIGSSSNGVLIIDTYGIISCVNEKASQIINMQPEVLAKKNVNVLDIFKENEGIIRLIKQFEKREKVKITYRNHPVLVDFIPFDIDNERMGATIILHDVSAFEEVLKEIKTNDAISKRLDSIVEYSYDGIYITDGEANTLRINEAYERITGLKRQDMMHRNTRDLVREGYISRSGSQEVIQKRTTISLNQTFRTGKTALITSKPIFDNEGNIVLIVTNVRDMTDLYDVKIKLEEQEQLAKKYYNEAKALKKQLMDTSDLIVEDKKMIDLLYSAQKVAKTDITIHLTGESGVGKEVLAKFIHNNSNRAKQNFIKVNCGAIPENLIESELFGYEKGAFTGASSEGKMGLFELADRGTLFLDEIGELSLNVQVKLLRVLQEGEVTKVGGVKPIKVDVRIISATNKNLTEMVKEHLFREDLYYRLSVIPLHIPPLRERQQDIIVLTRYFLDNINTKYGWEKTLSKEVLDVLHDYAWPGNIRELKNMIERIVVMSAHNRLEMEDLPNQMLKHQKAHIFSSVNEMMPLKDAVGIVEYQLIEKAYETYGNVREAAKALGIDASTFVRKRQRYQK